VATEATFVPESCDLVLYAGDGATLRITVTSAGEPLPLGSDVTAQIRQRRVDEEPKADFAVDLDEAAQGIAVLTLTGAQTADLVLDSRARDGAFSGYWDCQLTLPDEEPYTLVQGAVTCSPDVTREEL
jgi:hypothetical protein